MKIESHPAVADELEQIRDYYEDKSVGLGKPSSMNLSINCSTSRRCRRVGWSLGVMFGDR
jgi:hypothetical protein